MRWRIPEARLLLYTGPELGDEGRCIYPRVAAVAAYGVVCAFVIDSSGNERAILAARRLEWCLNTVPKAMPEGQREAMKRPYFKDGSSTTWLPTAISVPRATGSSSVV